MYSSQFPLSQFHFSFLFLISFISFSGFVFALGCDFLLHFSTFLYAFLVVSCFVFRGQERVFLLRFDGNVLLPVVFFLVCSERDWVYVFVFFCYHLSPVLDSSILLILLKR